MLEIEKHADLIREIFLQATFYDAEGEEIEGNPELLGLSKKRFHVLAQKLKLAPDTELYFYLKHLAPKHECMWDAALDLYGLTFRGEQQLKPVSAGLFMSDDAELVFEVPKQGTNSRVVFLDDHQPVKVANSIEQFFRMLRYSWELIDSEAHEKTGELDWDDVEGWVHYFKNVALLIDQVVPGCALPWLKSMSSWDIEDHWDQIKPESSTGI